MHAVAIVLVGGSLTVLQSPPVADVMTCYKALPSIIRQFKAEEIQAVGCLTPQALQTMMSRAR